MTDGAKIRGALATVDETIGFKRGTGERGGVSYLHRMREVALSPQLCHVGARL